MVLEQLQETVSAVRARSHLKPKLGIILGSGLGSFVNEIRTDCLFRYEDLPGFVPTAVEGHHGALILGQVGDVPVAALQGRVHFYEGHAMAQVVYPTRALAMLGIETLILTNAAGGLNTDMRPGDFMILKDHINLMGDNPLKGPHLKNFGPRFPDMTEAYDKDLVERMNDIFTTHGTRHHIGVYCGVSGPTYETPAEVRYLQKIGGNAVGMSTVPEAIAANHLGLRVAAVSCITNQASGLAKGKLSHQEVTETAKAVERQFCAFLKDLIATFKSH